VRRRLWCVSARSIFADLLHAYRSATTQQEAAQKLSVSKSLYQKIESGDRRPQRDFAERCDELYKTPGVFVRIYEDTVSEPYSAWFGPRVVYEDRATVITDWEQRGIPGLLQTEDYARAVIRACRPWDSPDALEQTIKARLERQDILSRDNPPKLWVVIAEGVLRQAVGGPHVMRDQLDHLVKMSESPQAVIQVLPFSASDAPGADGPAALFEFSDGPSVAYLEGWEAGRVVEDPKEVAAITTALSMIKSCALSPTNTRQLLGEIRG
jgi:transcriptional regulator with XRE-family HTH domain